MFIKMEEPKDFVTWLQVAKVCKSLFIILALSIIFIGKAWRYYKSNTNESETCCEDVTECVRTAE